MDNSKEITLANIVATHVYLIGNHLNTDIDLGSVTLFNGKKSYALDIIQSYRDYDEHTNITTVSFDLEIDKETFEEQCKFDLRDMDLLKIDTRGEIYFAMDDMDLVESAKIYLKIKCTPKTMLLKCVC
jgi:hypothetical protein